MSNLVRASRVGFGIGPFGQGFLGWGDWAEIILWNYIPSTPREQDDALAGPAGKPYRKWINSIKPSFNGLRRKIEFLPDVMTPELVQEDLIPFLASVVGWEDDQALSIDRRRAALLNAWQLYLNKGSALGYAIMGAFSNVIAVLEGIFEEECGSEVLTTAVPDLFTVNFDTIPSDVYSRFFDDFFPGGGETSFQLRLTSAVLTDRPNLLAINLFTISDPAELTVTPLTVGVHYTINLGTGLITLLGQPARKTFTATDATQSVFALAENAATAPVLATIDQVSQNGTVLTAGTDYTTDLVQGLVTLTAPAVTGDLVVVSYTTTGARRGVKYRARQDVNVPLDMFFTAESQWWPLHGEPWPYEAFAVTYGFSFATVTDPLLTLPVRNLTNPALTAVLSVSKDGALLAPLIDYTVNLLTGVITLLGTARPSTSGSDYQVSASASGTGPRCRTSKLRVHLTRVDGASSEAPLGLTAILKKLDLVRPIHVSFLDVTYDVNLDVSLVPSVELEVV